MFQSGKGTVHPLYIVSCEASLPFFFFFFFFVYVCVCVCVCASPSCSAHPGLQCTDCTLPASLPPSFPPCMPCFLFFPPPHYPPCGICSSVTHCSALKHKTPGPNSVYQHFSWFALALAGSSWVDFYHSLWVIKFRHWSMNFGVHNHHHHMLCRLA